MSKLCKILAVIAVTTFVILLATPTAQATHKCNAVKIALSTPCFHTQMTPFMESRMFTLKTEVFDQLPG